MTAWWTGGALGLDFESDGRDPAEARAITCALVSITPGNPAQEMELMLQPERDIPDEAAAIHGITTERARAEGVMRESGIASIAASIADLAGPERPVVGHNVCYDLTLLDREMRRCLIGRIEVDRAAGGMCVLVIGGVTATVFPVIDTYVLDKAIDKYRWGKRQLGAVAEFYGHPMAEGTAHGATADVLASLRIAWTIAKRSDLPLRDVTDLYADRQHPGRIAAEFRALRTYTLAELHLKQAGWAEGQADGLREYFRTSGTGDPKTVFGDWPVRPRGDDDE